MTRVFLSRLLIFVALLLSFAPARADTAPATMKFSELYSKITVRGIDFSPKLTGLAGQRVTMSGFMAPPLKPMLDFFVLTRVAMSSYPFCTTTADWPPDIVLVIMPDGRLLEPSIGVIRVTGRLEVGIKKDEQTGFVSLVRLYADKVENL